MARLGENDSIDVTLVKHLVNSFAQCMVVDARKMSMPFDSTSSLWSRTEKISM